MTLGDLGADVIKVEKPGEGDESRGWGPPFNSEGESAYYLSCNRNKLSVALDFENANDRSVLDELIAEADVVLENFRDGALAARGLRARQLLEKHPKLIWCTISGFGPGNRRPGYDFVVQAECGWMSVTGERDGEPMKAGIALADIIAGKDATIAILGALLQRDRSREPIPAESRHLHISLKQSATAALINVAQNALVTGNDARRWGNGHPNLVPYQLFATADARMVLAVGNDAQWKAACDALRLEDLAADAALRTNAGRLTQRDRIVTTIASRLAENVASYWLGALQQVGVPCGIVKTVKEALEGVSASQASGVSPAIPGSVRHRPPRLDEHGEMVRNRGWSVFRAS